MLAASSLGTIRVTADSCRLPVLTTVMLDSSTSPAPQDNTHTCLAAFLTPTASSQGDCCVMLLVAQRRASASNAPKHNTALSSDGCPKVRTSYCRLQWGGTECQVQGSGAVSQHHFGCVRLAADNNRGVAILLCCCCRDCHTDCGCLIVSDGPAKAQTYDDVRHTQRAHVPIFALVWHCTQPDDGQATMACCRQRNQSSVTLSSCSLYTQAMPLTAVYAAQS